MKHTMKLFEIGMKQVLKDGMLIALIPAPFLVGLFIKLAIPFINQILTKEFSFSIIAWYGLIDGMAEGYSYLFARIGLPMIWAFAVTMIVSKIFNISSLSTFTILDCSIISGFTGIFLAMMVVSIAGNRVEGLALSKLMGISFIGLILIWFLPAPYHFLMAFLPSFWIGKILLDGASFFSFILGLISCFLWIALFTRRFLKRV